MLEKFVEEEFMELSKKYNPKAEIKKCRLEFDNKRFFESFRETIINNRRGEVGFLLKRKNGKYVLARSKKYPAEVLRIPTGGIEFNESAEEALYRELREELGVSFDIYAFLGIIEYEIHYSDEIIKFYSYLFEINEKDGEILKDATQNEISFIKEFSADELQAAEKMLKENKGSWKDWCLFRAQLLGFFIDLSFRRN